MNLSPLPIQKFFDNNGNPLVGGLLFTYVAGTTTKIATYVDSGGLSVNTNPIVLDYRGECRVWLDITKIYKFVLSPPGDTDPPTKAFWTVDNIAAPVSLPDLTQAVIGGILYPKSSAENSAGVTIVNYAQYYGNILRYGGDPTGVASSDTAGQAMLNQRAAGGAPCYVPTGTYKQTVTWTYPLSSSRLYLYGDGMAATTITTANNIENIANAGADNSNGISVPIIRDLTLANTFPVVAGAGATKFHIHLQNPLRALISNVQTTGAFNDTDYNANNHGGIWFEAVGTYGAAFQNTIERCWIAQGQVLVGTSDSIVTESYVWGHPCDYAIKGTQGNLTVSDCPGIIGSRGHGGVWLAGALNSKIVNNFFDGSYDTTNSGFGVYCTGGAIWPVINNNIFWRQWYNGIYMDTPVSATITGNSFYDCGRSDTGGASADRLNSDIVIESISFGANSNTITGNTAYRGATRVNAALFILEISNGGSAVNNTYSHNTVAAGASQYKTPAIQTNLGLFNSPSGSRLVGNVGFGTETEIYVSSTNALTLTGCTTAPTVTPRITRQGNLVQIYVPSVSATSNTTSCLLTGIPAAYRPTNTARGFAFLQNNSAAVFGAWAVDSSGDITLYVANSSTGFTAAGTKGILDGLTLLYPLT